MPPPSEPRVRAAIDLRLVPTAMLVWAVTAAVIFRPMVAYPVVAVTLAIAIGLLWGWRAWAWRLGIGAITRGWRAVTTVMVPAVGVICAATATKMRVARARAHELFAEIDGTAKVRLRLVSAPKATEHGASAKARVEGLPGEVPVFADRDLLAIRRDTVLDASASVREATRPSISGIQLSLRGDAHVIAAPRGITDRIRQQLFETAQQLPVGPDRMISAMALGDERGFSMADREMMVRSGLSHLSAVSGANVALVVGAVIAALSWAGPRLRVASASVALLGFVKIVGTEPSVLRAVVTGCIGLLAVLLGRTGQALAALAAGVIGLVILAPDLAVSVGFALSVTATAGLVLLSEPLARRLAAATIMVRWPAPMVRAIAMSITAHVVTMPVLGALVGEISHVSLIANLLAAPAVAPVTILGSLAAVAAATGISWLVAGLLWCAAPFSWWIYFVARMSAEFMAPAASTVTLLISCGLTIACFIALFVRPRLALRAGALIARLASLCGCTIWVFGLDIPRAPQGWVAAVCTQNGHIIVIRAVKLVPTQVSRRCRIALGLADGVSSAEPSGKKTPPIGQQSFAELPIGSTKAGSAETTIVDSPSDVAEELASESQKRAGVGQEALTESTSPRWIVARNCGPRVRRIVLTPSGIPVVCPQRDGPQALYPSGRVWRGSTR